MAEEIHPGTQNIAAPPPVRICLNMIVKNESARIERCLSSVLPFLDTWCIVDTGSTDETPALISKFFAECGIPGRLVNTTFKNFAQARNAALQAARAVTAQEWDYALLVDADHVLEGTLDKSSLQAPAYELLQHDGNLDYPNTRLVRRNAPATYVGVTHEHLAVEGVTPLSTLRIHDFCDGANRPEKAERDIRLLSDGLIEEPDNVRYMFYLAQTLREVGRFQDAIRWYQRRIAGGGWDQEIWYSYYGIAHAYNGLGDEANFIKACLEAYNLQPTRGESLKLLSRFYREKGKSDAALLIAEALAETEYPGAQLFVERDVYDFGADQEIAISGFYSKLSRRRELGYKTCADLTVHPTGHIREEARRNFTFYAKSAKELFGAEIREIDWKPTEKGWAPMNPSVCIGLDGRRLVLVRTVNYVVADGQYPTNDGSGIIRTKNYIVEMDEEWHSTKATLIEDVTNTPRSKFPVEGFEDCRLWHADEGSWFGSSGYLISATVRDLSDNEDGRCEMVVAWLDEGWHVNELAPIRDFEHEKTQKNWMPIIERPGKFLYFCDPTIVIDTAGVPGTTEVARHEAPVCLVDLRGGSQLIQHDIQDAVYLCDNKGWLCLTHEVAWRPERVYLHRFVRFDSEFRIIAVTDPFYLLKVGIEFCAGLARDGERLVASFGVNDASAHLAFFDPSRIDNALNSF